MIFGSRWESSPSCPTQGNSKGCIAGVYLIQRGREAPGLLPEEEAPVLRWRREPMRLFRTARTVDEEGMVETGEGRTPRPEEPIIRICYKLVRQF